MSKLKCQWCSTNFTSKKKLEEHESTCKWKEKKLKWQSFLEENKDKNFWYVDSTEYKLKECILSGHYEMIRFKQEDGTYTTWSQGFSWDKLFDNKDDAQVKLDYYDNIYHKTFRHSPYFSHGENLENSLKHIEDYKTIERSIEERLKDFPNFDGIDFCDVGANGIQIRGHHKQIKGYTYGSQPTIKYDFSNCKDVIDEFVEMWKEKDNPKSITSELSFIADGEKYGWD